MADERSQEITLDEAKDVTMAQEPINDPLKDMADQLRAGVTIKDRSFRLTSYKKCFLGNEAVDFMVKAGMSANREEAVTLGQTLMTELSIFEHVTRDHEFKDEKLFYRFIERGDVALNSKTGKNFYWGDYLDPAGDTRSTTSSMQPTLPQPDLSLLPPNDVHVASHVWPMDKLNIELLEHVHPTGWVDPAGTNKYDLLVIGGGAAGLVTSAGAAGVGASVALIEENFLGGDCLNQGCVPSKSIIHAAHLAHTVKGDMEFLADSGVSIKGGAGAVEIDFAKVMERVRRIRTQISHHDSADRYSKELGVEIFMGRAKFLSKNSVTVNGKTLTFNKAVIATGGYPAMIPMEGLKELHKLHTNPGGKPRPIVMTNETFFNMTEQPTNMIVIGPGVIGLEMAQSMQRLGTPVTVMGRSGRILPKEDADHGMIIQKQLEKDGISFNLSVSKYVSIELTGKVNENGFPEMLFKFEEEGTVKEMLIDALLIATGRRPNVTGMDLEKANVEYDSRIGIIVNDNLRTSNPKIFSAGDCCSTFKFTHAADFMARAVIRNSLFLGSEKMSKLLIPYATFTDPEIASVGLYGSDLKARGIPYRTFEKHFKDNDRAICDGETDGMVRVRVAEKSDKILGATVIGKNAGNMISEFTLAMASGTGLGSIAAVIHPYPTTAEAVRQSGDLFNRTKLSSTVKTLLRGLIKVQR